MRGNIQNIFDKGLIGKGSDVLWYHFVFIVYPPSTWGIAWDFTSVAVLKEDIIIERRNTNFVSVRQSGSFGASIQYTLSGGLYNHLFIDVSNSTSNTNLYEHMRYTLIDLNG